MRGLRNIKIYFFLNAPLPFTSRSGKAVDRKQWNKRNACGQSLDTNENENASGNKKGIPKIAKTNDFIYV